MSDIDFSKYLGAAPEAPAAPQIDFSKYTTAPAAPAAPTTGAFRTYTNAIGAAEGGNFSDPEVMALAVPETKAALKAGAVAAGSAAVPELVAPEAGVALKALLSGIGAGAGTVAGQGATGQNPLAKEALTETGENALMGGMTDLLFGAGSSLLESKFGRGAVNSSMGATARDVTYGNPAKALLDEDIPSVRTGDLEKFKTALRNGQSFDEAMKAAGGRAADVSSKMDDLAPQLYMKLAPSKIKIPSSTITDPIDKAIATIKASRGVTQADATAAIDELNAMKQAALKVPGLPGATAKAWSPLEANTIKQEIGEEINWQGRERVGQLVQPVQKQVYQSLKEAVNGAVPDAADLNERLTNLHAARNVLMKEMGVEEVGQGKGVLGSNYSGLARRFEAGAGKIVPAINTGLTTQRTGARAFIPALNSLFSPYTRGNIADLMR